jgi:hypothetical protein
MELKMLYLKSIVRKSNRNRPWWLEGGMEICPACSQSYAYQTEYRCSACDGTVCAMCVEQTIEIEIFCPTCVVPNGAESEG